MLHRSHNHFFNDRLIQKIELYLPLFFLIISSLLIYIFDLDLKFSRLFYDSVKGDWFLLDQKWIEYTNQFGPFFSASFALIACFIWIHSFIEPSKQINRVASIFILLTYLMGPFFLIHVVLKETWDRPRPREVVEFNGTHPFVPLLHFGDSDYKGKSFPSGHASVGFAILCMYFLYKKKSKKKSLFFLFLGIITGVYLSSVRIFSGGHFLSDTLWGFAISWFTSYFLYYYFFEKLRKKPIKPFVKSIKRTVLIYGILCLLFFLPITLYFLSELIDKKLEPIQIKIPPSIENVVFSARVKKGNIHAGFKKQGPYVLIRSRVKGFGFPNTTLERTVHSEIKENTLYITVNIQPKGFYFEYQSHNHYTVPNNTEVKWEVHTELGKIFINQ